MFVAVVIVLVALLLLVAVRSTQPKTKSTSAELLQPFATFGSGKMEAVLPTDTSSGPRVYTVNVEIRGVDLMRGESMLDTPGFEAVDYIDVVKTFTYDSTWRSLILPASAAGQSRDAYYTINHDNGRLVINFFLEESAYLSGYVKVTLAALYPRPQDLSAFSITPLYLF